MRAVFLCATVLFLYSCKKPSRSPAEELYVADASDFVKYTIKSGEHYTAINKFNGIETAALAFTVRFDSSAVYKCNKAENQYDINKLYGFSDNGGNHHQYSARIGWRWSDGALRLFAYVYNEGNVVSEELGLVPIDAAIRCRIVVTEQAYVFYCDQYRLSLPRKSTTALGKGYLLYPYFGGNEPAPHEVRIWIKNE